MATHQIDLTKFSRYDKDYINSSFSTRTNPNTLNLLFNYREDIQKLTDIIRDDDYPEWFLVSVITIIRAFEQIIETPINSEPGPDAFGTKILAFKNILYYNMKDDRFPNIAYSLPLLINYAKTHNLEKISPNEFESVKQDATNEIEVLKNNYNEFKDKADATLSILNKEVGKIGVKEYAEIFDSQAKEHSVISKKGIGKAQWWILFAIVTFAVLVYLFTQLDSLFSIKGATTFTPEVVVHVIGRFLLISLFIFLVSFSFKQFRINMHLYTLNKHRANTLKSFEYLTRAPDKLEPSSYNAILMEVAKSIYEAGQTGYIINDGQTDMPSIIDLSKIITQPKTP